MLQMAKNMTTGEGFQNFPITFLYSPVKLSGKKLAVLCGNWLRGAYVH